MWGTWERASGTIRGFSLSFNHRNGHDDDHDDDVDGDDDAEDDDDADDDDAVDDGDDDDVGKEAVESMWRRFGAGEKLGKFSNVNTRVTPNMKI